MNKKLKFANLASPRYTRSMKKNISELANVAKNKSDYFSSEVKEEAKEVKSRVKKRSPIKTEPEESPEVKKEKTTSKECLSIKTELEEVSPVTAKKIAVKKRSPIKVEYENIPEAKIDKLQKTKSPKSQIKDGWQPENWKTLLANIMEMRKDHTAPVDEMGCHKCTDPNATASEARFQALVALMLSSQTKDQVTFAAMERLKNHGCTPGNIKITPNEELGKLIHPVGFWRRKVEYIKRTTEILLDQYAGDIPKTIEDLCKLPGVGPKMGHLCMQVAWGEVSGIGVDTHVHRISNRLGWVRKQTKTPEETRVQLESWLPKEKWVEVNHVLVGFGQEICQPVRPKCSGCLNKSICPFGRENIVKKSK